ncbi:hypothetical protein MASR1M90_10420 [Desulfovibrionales bacterium]
MPYAARPGAWALLVLCMTFFLGVAHLGYPKQGHAQNTTPTTPVLQLTDAEKEFLAAHPVLRLGIGVAYPPFQFVEQKNGVPQFSGLSADIVRLMEERLGVRMEPVYGITFAEALERGKKGTIDVFPCLSWTPERATFLAYTASYLNYPLVIVSRDNVPFISSLEDLQGLRLAEVKALSTYSKLRNDYPHIRVDYVFEETTQAMLEAVSFGKADACIVDLAVASYIINNRGLSNLKIAAPTNWKENKLAMGVPHDRTILAGILQKALDSITDEEMNAIRQHWLGLRYSALTNPEIFHQILLQGGGTILLVLAVILWRNRSLKKEIAERKLTEEKLSTLNKELEAIFGSVNTGITMLDLQGRYVLVNQWWKDFLGYDPKEMQAQLFDLITHPDDLKTSWECFSQVAQGHVLKNRCEKRYVHKNKNIVWADLSVSAIYTDAGDVEHVLCVVNDITDRKHLEMRLQELATTDSLTGLHNRRHFMELGQRAFETAARYGSALAVAMLDLDDFKVVNDTLGHDAGDTVLTHLGEAARSSFRAVDIVGRIGGEEFALLMPETDENQALIALERFRQSLATNPILYGSTPIHITISGGLAFFCPKEPLSDESLEAALKRADQALYQAKRSGKNKIELSLRDNLFSI